MSAKPDLVVEHTRGGTMTSLTPTRVSPPYTLRRQVGVWFVLSRLFAGAALQDPAPRHRSSSVLCLRGVTLYLHNVQCIFVPRDLRVFTKALAQRAHFLGFICSQQRENESRSPVYSSCVSPADVCLSPQCFLSILFQLI